jgi:hypothetical protein
MLSFHAYKRARVFTLISTVTAFLLLAGCSSERPSGVSTLVVPARIGVQGVDLAGVYQTVTQYFADAGVKMDAGKSDVHTGSWVSQPLRCSPSGDQRHVVQCVMSATVAPSTENPAQVAVDVKVRVGKEMEYDPNQAGNQVSIEPTLDRIVTALRAKYGIADVTRTDSLVF